MKKLLFSFTLFVSLALVGDRLMSYDSGGAWNITEVRVASITVVAGPATVQKVWLSSGSNTSGGNWAILVDSPIATSGTRHNDYTTAQVKSPALVFTSTNSYLGSEYGTPVVGIDYGVEGVFFSSAVTVWKNVGVSGQADRVIIKWRKGY